MALLHAHLCHDDIEGLNYILPSVLEGVKTFYNEPMYESYLYNCVIGASRGDSAFLSFSEDQTL